ncbi:hypothetical protein K438DRAFT_1814300 [Mycena galopus ATCC 62051]|nr:hypothetical protein K438DRAFT_1814300 [Mycena galopus ATCC 62051]
MRSVGGGAIILMLSYFTDQPLTRPAVPRLLRCRPRHHRLPDRPRRPRCLRTARARPLALLLTLLYSSFGFGSPVFPDEACERALDQAAVVALAGLLALTVRLHFLLVGAHYSALVRATRSGDAEDAPVQRIRLLSLPKGVKAADVVYTLVHCPAAANSLLGTSAEVWVRAPGTGAEASYAPASVSAPPSPASPAYAPAYVQLQPEPEREEQPWLDAWLLDARVVRTKPEWI